VVDVLEVSRGLPAKNEAVIVVTLGYLRLLVRKQADIVKDHNKYSSGCYCSNIHFRRLPVGKLAADVKSCSKVLAGHITRCVSYSCDLARKATL
jgi:hypothetical protein